MFFSLKQSLGCRVQPPALSPEPSFGLSECSIIKVPFKAGNTLISLLLGGLTCHGARKDEEGEKRVVDIWPAG